MDNLLGLLKEIYSDQEVQNTLVIKNKGIQLDLSNEHYNDAYGRAGNLKTKPIEELQEG